MRPKRPETRPELGAAILEVLDNQLRDGDPPETRATLDRLLARGTEKDEARRLIACVIAAEMFEVMKTSSPFDRERFVARLNALPELPWSDDEETS
jgi:hypothetical protein